MKNKLFSYFLCIFLVGFIYDAKSQQINIGSQIWATKNLSVTIYRNGDSIPQVTDQKKWAILTTGAWCYYNNDIENDLKYGKLYNWYAVNDPRGLAPEGWHLPSDAEWTKLSDYLGGEAIAGLKLKSKTGWNYMGNGTNSSGFSGLPGGCRNSNGLFDDIGNYGNWWSTSEYAVSDALGRNLGCNFNLIYKYDDDVHFGFSVRCLK